MRNSLLLWILGFPLFLGSAGCTSGGGTVNRVPLTITNGTPPSGTVGMAYGPAGLTASGGVIPYT